jgi:hypothetical protein
MRLACTTFADCDLVILEDDDDPQDVAGDQFAEFECSPCPFDPVGHLFLSDATATQCVHCGKIVG